MNIAEEYRNKTQKEITLPTGIKIKIKKLSLEDCISLGDIPQAFFSGSPEKVVKEDVTFGAKLFEVILSNCIVGPPSFRPVKKSPQECNIAIGEISLSEIAPEDVNEIVHQVCAFTKLGKEAAVQAKPFPEQQESFSHDSSPS